MDENIEKPAGQDNGSAEVRPDVLELGGSIQLSGFSGIDGGQMVVVKKIVGNYAKRLSDGKDTDNLDYSTYNDFKKFDIGAGLSLTASF